MKSLYVKIGIFVHRTAMLVLIVGLLTACGSQATSTPASSPTEAVVAPATQAPTDPPLPTDTVAPTDTAVTEAPPPIPAEIPDVQPSTTVAVDQTVAPLDQDGHANQTWRAYGLVVGGIAMLMIIGFVAWSRSRRWQ